MKLRRYSQEISQGLRKPDTAVSLSEQAVVDERREGIGIAIGESLMGATFAGASMIAGTVFGAEGHFGDMSGAFVIAAAGAAIAVRNLVEAHTLAQPAPEPHR